MMTNLTCDVIKALKGKTLVTAESCTGGGIGAALTSVPGSSEVFKGGIICYTNWVKEHCLGVDAAVLEKYGAVNSQNNVDLDTGAILMSSKMTEDLYSLVDTKEKFDKFVNEKARISFYADFLYPLAKNSTLEQYYKETPEGDFTEELKDYYRAKTESSVAEQTKVFESFDTYHEQIHN